MTTNLATAGALPGQRSRVRSRQRNRQDKRDPRLPIAGLFTEERARQLWQSLPENHQQDHFDSTNMPEDYQQAFTTATIDRNRGWFTQSLSFRGLPTPMVWELAWCVHQKVVDGYAINTGRLQDMRRGLALAIEHGTSTARSARSLTALTHEEWEQEVRRALMRTNTSTNAHLPAHVGSSVKHLQDRLAHAYHDGEWWRLNVWNPQLDRRIPQREHEPQGQKVANFSQLTTEWLREAAKWWLSVQLSTQHYVWSSVKSRLDHLKWLQWYIDQVGCSGPGLVSSPDELRPWLMGFVDSLNGHVAVTGPNKGGRLAKNSRRGPLVTIETFYRWMHDHRAEAVKVLSEPRWSQLGLQHTVLFRMEDKPRLTNQPPDDMALEDEVISQIAAGSGILADPKSEGGLEDRQAFHALMLLIRTGRRMSEVLMMDFEPLMPLLRSGDHDGSSEPDGFVARMRYQQTKITSGDPPSIPVDQEVVDLIRIQQQWARDFITEHGAPEGTDPRYLFVQTKNNRLGLRSYAAATFNTRLGELTKRLAIRDSLGRPVMTSKTHTFRHTRATDLLNAGVPIHVVMRYLGHVTPAMTMHYAKTLSITAEREFLRYKKVTSDGRTAADPSDLFDLMHLDKRADRALPNGWCLLPPRQICEKGNACLTCDKFVTDETHREELQRQLADTSQLVHRRQAQFTARHGEPMGPDNVWLANRTREQTALRKILISLDEVGVRDGENLRAVRGAGAVDRESPLGGDRTGRDAT